MNNTTQQTTFWKFLSEHTIVIPIIQRDYAQGRKDKISLRKGFLGDLKKALDKNLPNGEENLKLDFVYGSTENGKLQPLDGQQRLTTLWLLHWYIALCAGKLEDAAHVLSKFTYETRISSREFCKQLCIPDNFQTLDPSEKIVPYITNQTWFFSVWKQDPTIQAMLTMLSGTPDKAKNGEEIIDGLEEAFTCKDCLPNDSKQCKFGSYWELLTSDSCPIIFYYLDLLGLKLSDDLYIKMNARGKQLTSFENFKADLIKYINEKKESSLIDKEKNKWNTLLDPEEGLPIKMDTTWMDIFWKNKSEDFRVDEIYFAFLNRFFLNYYIVDSSKTAEEIESDGIFNYFYGEKSNDTQVQYTSFSKYKQLNLQVIDALMHVLDNYHSVLESYHYPLNDKGLLKLEDLFPVWVDKNLVFIPKYANDSITTLTQPQRVVFYAICRYFEKCESNYNKIQFKQWMRVVWNIVENANVNTISTMIGCMRLVKELSEGCLFIYDFLSSSKIKSEAVKEQVREEIEKVKKIVVDDRWEDKIIQAESCAFFKGAIRFLFRDENGEINEKSWKYFDPKWKNAWKYFDENGVKDAFRQDAKLLRYYFSLCTKWGQLWGFDYDFTPASWRNILLKHSAPVHQMLIDENPDFQTAKYISKITNFENGYENIQKHVHEVLMYTDILVEASKYGMRLNWKYDTYCLYPSNAKADWKKYVIGNYRNEILFDLCDKGFAKGIDNRRFGSCNQFFWGWNVDFSYCNHTFRWHQNNYVYLMNQDPKNPNGYTYRNQNKKEELEIYCCFKAEGIDDSVEFIKQLNDLIKEHENRCSQCTDQTSEQPAEQ